MRTHLPRAEKNDLAEIFGYAPDDYSPIAQKQRDSENCPFVGGTCIKHNNENDLIYGSCSVKNLTRNGVEEVIICPQRFYNNNYKVLHDCIADAFEHDDPIFTANEYSAMKK